MSPATWDCRLPTTNPSALCRLVPELRSPLRFEVRRAGLHSSSRASRLRRGDLRVAPPDFAIMGAEGERHEIADLRFGGFT